MGIISGVTSERRRARPNRENPLDRRRTTCGVLPGSRRLSLRWTSRIAGAFVALVIGSSAVIVLGGVPAATAAPSVTKPSGIIVPAYQYPLSAPGTLQGIWADLASDPPPGGTGYVIADPSNGPGSGAFFSGLDYTNYLYAIGQVQAKGWTVLGYTPTGYGTRTLSTVERGVGLWRSRYGTSQVGPGKLTSPVSSIFFDTACAGTRWAGSGGGGCHNKPSGFVGSPASFFGDLTSYVHASVGGIAVVNPGIQPLDSSFLSTPSVDDAVIVFENQYSVYAGSPGPPDDNAAVNSIGMVVWDASAVAEAQRVLQSASANGASLVYVTTEDDDGFYCAAGDVYVGTPPSCTVSVPDYFASELASVAAWSGHTGVAGTAFTLGRQP